MKGRFISRAVIVLLCVFAVVAACIGVSAETGTDVEAASPSWSVFTTDIIIPSSVITVIPFWPDITDVSPNGGLIAGGEEVVITGSGFIGAEEVTFGGTPATSFTVDSNTQITAIAPMHAPGSVQVMVIEGLWESADTSADDYTYVEAPTTTEPPAPAAPSTESPTTEPPTTAAPTETAGMATTTIAAAAEGEGDDGGGLSGGWIAFIAVIAVAAVGGMGMFVYRLGKGSS